MFVQSKGDCSSRVPPPTPALSGRLRLEPDDLTDEEMPINSECALYSGSNAAGGAGPSIYRDRRMFRSRQTVTAKKDVHEGEMVK